MPFLIFKEQKDFIQGRNIHDSICLAFEAFNMMDRKCFSDKLLILLIENFLLKVLDSFGFSSKYLEEVLSRGISRLVFVGVVKPMLGPKNSPFLSHTLYVDDILIFCKGTKANLQVMFSFFSSYAAALGQVFSPSKSSFFVGGISINHHINSFIWLRIKDHCNLVLDNSYWSLVNGNRIHFWKDAWSGSLFLNEIGNVSLSDVNINFDAIISNYSTNLDWNVFVAWFNLFSFLEERLVDFVVHEGNRENLLCWKSFFNGLLSLKDAYAFIHRNSTQDLWAKNLWNNNIPLSRSLLVWRLHQNKIPTYDQLNLRGFSIMSKCSLCNRHVENSDNLFFSCSFVVDF
ncbi:unnamed protein product [Vicia faba]|uniref:Reverse transcriptase zinc-binding domain-containing protein n=1 Tax=Vicia faba TaxID=3906 RepID=A0AAV1A2K8_VICFA|nr:unnamed protein product [Vicia faba]